VRLEEFKVLPSTHSQKAGKVTFVVKNVGKINHEMVVVKTNVRPRKLRENAEHEVSEKGTVGEAPDVALVQRRRPLQGRAVHGVHGHQVAMDMTMDGAARTGQAAAPRVCLLGYGGWAVVGVACANGRETSE
jgi:hypothetical protein